MTPEFSVQNDTFEMWKNDTGQFVIMERLTREIYFVEPNDLPDLARVVNQAVEVIKEKT